MMANRWKAGALLVAAALAGGATGAVVTARVLQPGAAGGDDRRGHRMEGYVKLLDKSLRLNPAQEDSVRAILTRHRDEMNAIWHDVEPRYETLRAVIRSEIRQQLAADQAGEYDSLTARLDRERRADHE
jgi:Spy/CpxP family protein refolding chaperone